MKMFKWFLKRPYIYSILIIIAIAGVYFFAFGNSGGGELETFAVARGDVRQQVSITGKVEASESVELGFENSGRITQVRADVGARVSAGQVLAELYNADLYSDLAEAEATLKVRQAELDDAKKGSRPEDIAISEAKVENAEQNLFDKINDSYTKADDAVHDKVDQFFSNPNSSPQLNFQIAGQLKADVESSRYVLNPKFKAWANSLSKITSDANLFPFSGESLEYLRQVRSFLDVVAIAVNELDPTNNLSQATVDSYRADVSTARTNVNTAINNLSSASSALKIAQSEYAKELAGSTEEEILVKEAEVERAKASINNIRAQISKTVLISPISGVVTKQEAKRGQIVSASAAVVSIISDSKFEVEANLPEAEVSKVRVGDSADLTLDAYGEAVKFEAKVIAIDPAETIVDGVSAYKVTIAFLRNDERVKSGLTANINVFGLKKENVLYVPQRAITSKDGMKYVRVQNPDGRVDEVKVELGLYGSDGRVELISGVAEGTILVVSLAI